MLAFPVDSSSTLLTLYAGRGVILHLFLIILDSVFIKIKIMFAVVKIIFQKKYFQHIKLPEVNMVDLINKIST
jgi:hypothetical protein